jgi:hypothetical protein
MESVPVGKDGDSGSLKPAWKRDTGIPSFFSNSVLAVEVLID